ncbi:MAG TPA: phosphonoacetaldehyde hydrolase [Candidatus Scybalocola faecigallinarum]|uniref:Phosphonoacetaldehyde hydrolase n=1 Tax=Candidatus Scybalocola faecigallinarum TaxID=2840941 RepID=A0A9D1F452_9FIRM|nr:phosphonoacetaldehyde hydrolase [Candidatus Scybalocola faecigallinarum]
MKFDGIIFDWAGTTVDYGCFAPVKAFVDAFEAFGITPTLEEVRKPMGMLKIDHVRTMLSMERISRLWEEKYGRAWTEEDVHAVYELSESLILKTVEQYSDPKPYVTETVDALREMGLKIGSTTGYNDAMMAIVVPAAKAAGYSPDCWFSPDSTGQKGRPYPYIVFRNMEALGLSCVSRVMKVGDTVADIKEGKNAGLVSVGIIEGSSVMGLTKEEYEALSPEEKAAEAQRVTAVYKEAGADFVVSDIRGILELVK